MPNKFGAASMSGANDLKFQNKYNYLIELIDAKIKMLSAAIGNGVSIDDGVLTIDTASASTDGLLTDDDWNLFNRKKGLHGIYGTPPQDVLQWNESNHTLTITEITYYYQGYYCHYHMLTKDITLDLVQYTTMYVYFADASGGLTISSSEWNYVYDVPVCTVFWNGTTTSVMRCFAPHDIDHNTLDWLFRTSNSSYDMGWNMTKPSATYDGELSLSYGQAWFMGFNVSTVGAITTMRAWIRLNESYISFADYSLPYLGTLGAPVYLDLSDYSLKTFAANEYACYYYYISTDVDRQLHVLPMQSTGAFASLNELRDSISTLDPSYFEMGGQPSSYMLLYRVIYSGDGQFIEAMDYRRSKKQQTYWGNELLIPALNITYAPSGNIAATSVQGAITELDTDKQVAGNELTALQALADTAGFMKKVGDGSYTIDTNTYATSTTASGKKPYHGIEAYAGLSWSDADHTVTLSSVTYWYKGTQYTTASPVVCDLDLVADRDNSSNTLTTDKLYFIYFKDATGKLYWSDTSWNFFENVFVATVYWNGTNGACQLEAHGYRRDIDWHIWAHDTIGTRYESGFTMTSPTVADDGTLNIGTGTIHDEDLDFATGAMTTMRGWYRNGASSFTFRNYSLPYLGTAGAPEFLDTDTNSLATFSATDFACYWYYASLDISRPLYVVPTHASTAFNTLVLARANTAPATIGVNQEYKLIYKVIYKGNGDFEEMVDYRSSSPVPGGGTPTVTAGSVSFAPAGGLSSTNVQAALQELDTEKQAALTFGIADTNAVRIDAADVADNEYARFTANGLESRSTAEVLSDIGAAASGHDHSGTYLPVATLDDTAYGAGWDGDTTHAPTKNAVYDKIAAMGGGVAVADIGSTAETVGGSVDNGTAATAARSDHKHAITNPKLDDLATPDNNTDLDANTTNHGLLLKATAPAAGLMNVVGLVNGETSYANKALFDTTNPADTGVVASPGTQVVAARRDHVHITGSHIHTEYRAESPGSPFSTGYLIQTTIAANTDTLFTLTITGNSYTLGETIYMIIEGRNYNTGDDIDNIHGVALEYTQQVEILNYGGYLYFWTAVPASGAALNFYCTRSAAGAYNHVSESTDTATPVAGKTRSHTITPTAVGGTSGASVTISDDPPGTPTAGDLWWESDTGILKIYYGAAWVDASPIYTPTYGIADDNAVQIDSADVADNEYARFTANGLESRTITELRDDLKTVDGTGSGLDADTVDTYHGVDLWKRIAYYGAGSEDPDTTEYPLLVTNHANCPAALYHYVLTFFYSTLSTSRSQIAIKYADSTGIWSRKYYSGAWTAWSKTFDATNGDTLSGNITFADAVNMVFNTTTGTKIGTATNQKIGFYNATPIVQPSAYTQTYSTASKTAAALTVAALTDNSGGSANTTLEAVGTTYSQSVIRNNFADLAAMANKATTDIASVYKVVTQIIDDLQALGLLS